MKYKTWYFKYTKAITEEVYNQIVASLASMGFEQYLHFASAMGYSDFVKHGFIRSKREELRWCIDNNPQSCKNEMFLEDFSINKITAYEIY